MAGQLGIRPVDLRVVQVRLVHPRLQVVRDQPRGDRAEELERLHVALGPRVLVQPEHRAHEHVPRAGQHHRERPDHQPLPGRRVQPPAQLPVIDLRLGAGLGRIRAQHPHLRAARLLRQVRRHIPAETGHRHRQPPLITQPLMNRRHRHIRRQLGGDELVMLSDRRPGHLPQPGIGQLREPHPHPGSPLGLADRRPARAHPRRGRRGRVLADRPAIHAQAGRDLVLRPSRVPVDQDLRNVDHVEGSPCHRPPALQTGRTLLLPDGQVHPTRTRHAHEQLRDRGEQLRDRYQLNPGDFRDRPHDEACIGAPQGR